MKHKMATAEVVHESSQGHDLADKYMVGFESIPNSATFSKGREPPRYSPFYNTVTPDSPPIAVFSFLS